MYTKEYPILVPYFEGYEFTGEIRFPKKDEFYYSVRAFNESGVTTTKPSIFSDTLPPLRISFIFRKTEKTHGEIASYCNDSYYIHAKTFFMWDVYNVKSIHELETKIPKGYMATVFTIPGPEDEYLTLQFNVVKGPLEVYMGHYGFISVRPRLILRKVE